MRGSPDINPSLVEKDVLVFFFFLTLLGTHGIVEDDLDVLVSALTSVDFKESQVQILRESDEPYSSGSRAE